ncbi:MULTISPECIES: hypothetical protein [Klebsiella]|uniref:Membrane protein n=1 Tax=Klebsiella pneumoniae TaxID=573 RepID=A0A3P8ML35_KLEPN|nr:MULTISPECIES: hypothetical protein [Klebsiella]AVE20021.1 Membrane protein [Klebsiella pneumoniae]AVO80586.1 hypothetical protein AM459_25935 [Klebsiella pneumoniae]AWD06635.1 hypothetical protein AM407_27540 [Klebsiella aerogenes]MBK3310064.1 hypothetical protein [Klebsiella pneumoniae]MCA4052383.1 hypothetical protein [Klebsiella aerogenes]
MTEPRKDDDTNDADFEKSEVESEQKKMTFFVSYSFIEKTVKVIIVAAVLTCIGLFIGKHLNKGTSLFNDSVKIAVLNPSALNEQYLKAHNGNNEGYLPYIRKLMALYRARDFLVLDMSYVITRPSTVSEVAYINESELESELTEFGIDPKYFEGKQ